MTQLDEALGHVGLAQPGSPKLINMLLENGFLPVVSSIGVTDDGQLMNVNADQAATALAATLGADLILLSDVSDILDGRHADWHAYSGLTICSPDGGCVLSGLCEQKL